ncbi:MAG: hypothetical protein HY306_01680 [Nitrosomonadales bacterium]|nr:hypothetical protein [Nitrosomonadales bacterium]
MRNSRAMQTACSAATALLLLLGFSICDADELPAKYQESAKPGRFNLWINPGLVSYHFDHSAGYRGKNWGFGAQSDLSEQLTVQAGNFINSDRVRSNYAGLAWQPLSWHSIRIGVAAAAFDGYPAMRDGNWFFAAMPWISLRGERLGVNLTVIPSYGSRLHGAVSAQMIFRVW